MGNDRSRIQYWPLRGHIQLVSPEDSPIFTYTASMGCEGYSQRKKNKAHSDLTDGQFNPSQSWV